MHKEIGSSSAEDVGGGMFGAGDDAEGLVGGTAEGLVGGTAEGRGRRW